MSNIVQRAKEYLNGKTTTITTKLNPIPRMKSMLENMRYEANEKQKQKNLKLMRDFIKRVADETEMKISIPLKEGEEGTEVELTERNLMEMDYKDTIELVETIIMELEATI